MDNTNLDELVEYPAKAINVLGTNQDIVSLITNIPNIDMSSDIAYSVFSNNIFDYGYVDSTTNETAAYICVEAEGTKAGSPTVMPLRLYVTIFWHKNYMKLAPEKFPGVVGNRRDNLVRCIDNLLNGTDFFGIGPLSLQSIVTRSAPIGFTARELTYAVPDYKKLR